MQVAVAVAQVPVTWDIGQNLSAITANLADTRPGEIVVLPEACVSGYDDSLSRLDRLDPDALASGIDRLAELARGKGIHLFCGSLLLTRGAWWNAALYLSPDGRRSQHDHLAARRGSRRAARGPDGDPAKAHRHSRGLRLVSRPTADRPAAPALPWRRAWPG